MWAIGTGRTASPEEAQAVHATLRARLAKSGAAEVPLLYGGSVKADNAKALFAMADIDGGLIGGASLKVGGIFGDRAGLTARCRSETMNMLETVLLVVHLLVAVAICGFVLLQHGKGADMGAAFGSGSSGSLFGAAGSANFLSRTTAILAAVFFASSLGLTWFGSHHTGAVGRDAAGRHGKDGAEDLRRSRGSGSAAGAALRRPRIRRTSAPAAARAARTEGSKVGRSAEVNEADVVKLVDTLS